MINFNCEDCRTPEGHAVCAERNKDKQGKGCDCQHRGTPADPRR